MCYQMPYSLISLLTSQPYRISRRPVRLSASHVLEHAYDLPQVLKEWARVTKPSGLWVIEMPINFTPTAVDRIDVQSLKAFWPTLRQYLQKPLWAQDNGKVIRLIARTR